MRFMITISMKDGNTQKDVQEMLKALPAQQANDTRLMEQVIQEIPALVAADRSVGWLILNCESEEKVQEILQTSPIYQYSEYKITALLATEENVPQ